MSCSVGAGVLYELVFYELELEFYELFYELSRCSMSCSVGAGVL